MPDAPAESEADPVPNRSDVVVSPTVTFSCATCGGQGVWHGGRQDVVCASCATAIQFPPAAIGAVDRFDLIPLLRDRADSGRTWQPVATSVRCATCHGVTRLRAGVAATRCETCGAASLVVIDQSGAPITPTGVLPFRLSDADARDAVRAWVADHARMDFGRSRSAAIELRSVYLPWWNFFAHVHCPWRMETTKRDRDGNVERVVTDGTVDLDLDETLPAVQEADAALRASAGPLDMASARLFDARYLAGTTVEHYTVNLWDGWDTAHARMEAQLDQALRKDAGNWLVLPDERWPSWTQESARLILIPVFVGTCTIRGRETPVVVNGATGQVSGAWHWSLGARILGMALLAALVAGVVALAWGAWLGLRAIGFRPLW